MSAGAFQIVGYSADNATVYPIRIQPETATLSIGGVANAPTATEITAGTPSANAGGSRRKNGVNARQVRFKFTGTPPAGYKADSTISLPVLTTTAYNSYSRGQTGTYLGGTIICVGKTAESIR